MYDLKTVRKELGLSQADCAQVLGCSRATVGYKERTGKQITEAEATKLFNTTVTPKPKPKTSELQRAYMCGYSKGRAYQKKIIVDERMRLPPSRPNRVILNAAPTRSLFSSVIQFLRNGLQI